MKRHLTPILVALAFSPALVATSFALPKNVTLTELGGKSGTLSFESYAHAAINNNGQVCYKGADLNRSAIIEHDGTTRLQVAANDEAAGTFSQFLTGICSINDNQEIVFDVCDKCKAAIVPGAVAQATDPSEPIEYAVFKRVRDNASFIPITVVDSRIQTQFKQVSLPSMNFAGDVAFSGELDDGTKGIYLRSGATISALADSSGPFETLGAVFINSSLQAVFGAQEDSPSTLRGIYKIPALPIMGSFNGFGTTSLPVINAGGTVALMARSAVSPTPLSGVYLDGTALVQSGVDFAEVDLSSTQAISLNDRGEVVFPAFRPNGNTVVFAAAPGGMLPLVEQGEILPGYSSPVSFATVGRQAFNNRQQIVLMVALEDKTQLVLRFDPIGELFPPDLCPADDAKFEPGECGCGISDVDTNGDGVKDCLVTQAAYDFTQQIISRLPKLKFLPKSAKKAKKAEQRALRAELKSFAARLQDLVKTSFNLLVLANAKANPQKLSTTVRKKVTAATGASASNLSSAKKQATSAARKFARALAP